MTRSDFLRALEKLMEFEPGHLKGNETLEELGRWDSLAIVSFLAMADEKMGLQLGADRVNKAKTVQDLAALADSALSG